jgi:hypothetical protein
VLAASFLLPVSHEVVYRMPDYNQEASVTYDLLGIKGQMTLSSVASAFQGDQDKLHPELHSNPKHEGRT